MAYNEIIEESNEDESTARHMDTLGSNGSMKDNKTLNFSKENRSKAIQNNDTK